MEKYHFAPFSFAGCKIKALRAKTNTYIKTPARGEEPVFVVTGSREEVAAAKKEIMSAAEHFTNIRCVQSSGVYK
jgi:RNA-binding protein MEX3